MIFSNFYYRLLSLVCTAALGAEGFVAGTLIKTSSGYVPIEEITRNAEIICCDEQGDIVTSIVSEVSLDTTEDVITIEVGASCISMDSEQKIFVQNPQSWIAAQDIHEHDILWDGKPVRSVSLKKERQITYSLSVEQYHNFFVSEEDILVHNFIMIFSAASAVVPMITTVVESIPAITLAAGCLYSLLAKPLLEMASHAQIRNDTHNNNGQWCWCGCACATSCTCICFCQCGQRNKNNKASEEYHPHGIYQDAGYHHPKSTGNCKTGKSASPKAGQKALDNSVKDPGNGNRRVGVSEGEIVVLNKTLEGFFHGYVITWHDLESTDYLHAVLNEMIKEGLITKKGKILK